ncbi:MAG: Coenzyme synthesis protein (PqqD) [Acidimicrobiales bacterium]|nr:Coenzyme synthesis protein (PqqD) [Acidimicrobiales bacterium]
MTFDATAVPIRQPGVLDAVVDDEVVLLAEGASRYHALDAVGSRVWALLDGTRTVDAICAELVATFAVDEETCRRDVLTFLDDLAANGLVAAA